MSGKQWKRDFGIHYVGERDFFKLFIVVFIIIGVLLKKVILFWVIGLLLAYLFINYIYNRSLGRHLHLKNKREIIKLFQGEHGNLSFELENDSRFPIIYGQFRFEINPILTSLDSEELADQTAQVPSFQKSFTIRSREKAVIQFPFEAKARGVTKIRNITYTFPHLFNFNIASLLYIPQYFTEVIVFPKPLQVIGIEKALQMVPGNTQINLSPFEEIQSPIHTRDYENRDPFNRINWKASVKTQQLQTNEYEKIVDMSYLFIVNIRHYQNGVQVNKEMEKILSYTTYICQQAMQANVPYDLYINARTTSINPFLHLPEGEGMAHYARALELLARIPRFATSYPFTHMLLQARKRVSTSRVIVIIGHTSEEVVPIVNEWKRRHKDIFHVVPNEDGAVLVRWGKDVRMRA